MKINIILSSEDEKVLLEKNNYVAEDILVWYPTDFDKDFKTSVEIYEKDGYGLKSYYVRVAYKANERPKIFDEKYIDNNSLTYYKYDFVINMLFNETLKNVIFCMNEKSTF